IVPNDDTEGITLQIMNAGSNLSEFGERNLVFSDGEAENGEICMGFTYWTRPFDLNVKKYFAFIYFAFLSLYFIGTMGFVFELKEKYELCRKP
ncbi:MAG: hypothetical protein K6G57_04965, partial [Lachnospiraceae bacterium]|nr:hypothetical protein [Lachnospiraceae bacterium]